MAGYGRVLEAGRGPGESMVPPGSYNFWSILPKLYLRTALFSNLHQKVLQGLNRKKSTAPQSLLLIHDNRLYYISLHIFPTTSPTIFTPHWKRPAWRTLTSPVVGSLQAVRIRACSALPLLTIVREALSKTLKRPRHVPRDPCACFGSIKQGVDFMHAQSTPTCAHVGSVETSLKFGHALDFDLWSWEPGCNFQV